MANSHKVVINDVGEVVGGETIGFEQHLVIKLFVFDADIAIDVVKKKLDVPQAGCAAE